MKGLVFSVGIWLYTCTCNLKRRLSTSHEVIYAWFSKRILEKRCMLSFLLSSTLMWVSISTPSSPQSSCCWMILRYMTNTGACKFKYFSSPPQSSSSTSSFSPLLTMCFWLAVESLSWWGLISGEVVQIYVSIEMLLDVQLQHCMLSITLILQMAEPGSGKCDWQFAFLFFLSFLPSAGLPQGAWTVSSHTFAKECGR